MVAARLGARLRHLVALLQEALGSDAEQLPDIARAVHDLQVCVNTDLPPCKGQKRPWRPRAYLDRNEPGVVKSIKRLQNQVNWLRRMRQKAEASRAQMRLGKAKEQNNRTTSSFLARVALEKTRARVSLCVMLS